MKKAKYLDFIGKCKAKGRERLKALTPKNTVCCLKKSIKPNVGKLPKS